MLNCLFNFYTEKNISNDKLCKLKEKYKNEFKDKLNSETIELIDEAETYEDLIAVLLNNVYFELLDLYIDN